MIKNTFNSIHSLHLDTIQASNEPEREATPVPIERIYGPDADPQPARDLLTVPGLSEPADQILHKLAPLLGAAAAMTQSILDAIPEDADCPARKNFKAAKDFMDMALTQTFQAVGSVMVFPQPAILKAFERSAEPSAGQAV